jgi:hypothetical protein
MIGGLDVLTAVAFSLCQAWGLATCDGRTIDNEWLNRGGMCGHYGCHWNVSCPNDRADDCFKPEDDCIHIYNYPTIGSLKSFRRDDTLDGPGGKHYICRKRTAQS